MGAKIDDTYVKRSNQALKVRLDSLLSQLQQYKDRSRESRSSRECKNYWLRLERAVLYSAKSCSARPPFFEEAPNDADRC